MPAAELKNGVKVFFAKNRKAFRTWLEKNHAPPLPPSSKKIILNWIYSAKRPETRSQRVTETVKLAAKGIKANHYRPKQDG